MHHALHCIPTQSLTSPSPLPPANIPTPVIAVTSDLQVVAEVKVDFDADFGAKYGVTKGVHSTAESEVYAPVAMWLEALDLVLQRLQEKIELGRIRGISGSCQQHGSVYWGTGAGLKLGALKPDGALVEQLEGALAHPFAPNWQDHSTGAECEQFNAKLGSSEKLAEATGSGAHFVSASPSHISPVLLVLGGGFGRGNKRKWVDRG